MAAPANTTAATATVIPSLPAHLAQSVVDAGTTYTVWYRYTAAADVTWISVWGFGDLTTYQPTVSAWLGPTGAPVSYLGIQETNVPVQLPVTAGTTYYFKFVPNAGNPAPAVLTLSVLRGPRYTVPIGSLAVNDDTDGFPLVFLDSTTGAVLNIAPGFPAGEAGDTLASGVMAAANLADATIEVWSAAVTPVGTPLAFPGAGNLFGMIRAHSSGKFYAGDSTTDQVRTVTASGAFGPTTWTGVGSSLQALAANQAETRLYYADYGDHTTKIWNLTTNAAVGLFVAFPTGYNATDILVLADDTILIAYSTPSAGASRVVHYTTSATVLRTDDFASLAGPAGTPSRLASAIDPGAYWIWTHHDGGISRFRQIRVSDGAVVTTIDTTEFEVGGAQPAATADPARFGHSYSCPFWVTRALLAGFDGPAPPGGGGGDGGGGGGLTPPYAAASHHVDARYIRRLRRAPHVAQDNQRVVYRRFELDLERGQALADGQGSDPYVLLRISRDGGQTWGEEIRMAAGHLGDYTTRVLARRLGQARDTVFEVVVSDPIAWALVGAWLDLEPGTN